MGKRTRIINDPSELVPLLKTFEHQKHKQVYDALSNMWMSEKQLEEYIGDDVTSSINILKKGGLIESQWQMPEPGKKPEKEYHSAYSKVQSNFQCSLDDLSDIITLAFQPYEEIKDTLEELEEMVKQGNNSLNNLARSLNKSPLYLRSLARRSDKLSVMGQRLRVKEDTK
ncbi:ArsR family transcriptional regulator [Methanohalobium sp.]|uniref:ArsR family transcriptional regulator n=1 Tax=Methanohalobium sp. TaxID=2837493 RepID=UPI0025F91BED|nr:ArsR family transcriptional regulator [Methanohalobium sp.]